MPVSIVVVTGASGVGKTAAVGALEALAIPGVHCFYFDSIGVPTLDVMTREHGSPEAWQVWATNQWLIRTSFSLIAPRTCARPGFVRFEGSPS